MKTKILGIPNLGKPIIKIFAIDVKKD